ncbi:PPOX class F420-dependent oxidoreductase [Streptomyces ferrugineus]|uniref:PPOX class F420-dependent oxidoreductase n=1 Tax=Streptomyces ferrugineus TaxID=1413221 RepID=A0A7M2SA84_9ACTN|nr:PPOX class F420-dependent oxidoreductase [Streptomyces ferrugineus]QOV33172.1 PPOX class F420-dependent oxidoreductase [Streptomyces ferrugineus]
MSRLTEFARRLASGPNYATIATIGKDGLPQQSVVWVKATDDGIAFSTVEGRVKHLNLLRDPRASVLIADRDNPYAYAVVRGAATMTRDGGPELIDELSHKYAGRSWLETATTPRVVVTIRAERVTEYGS